MCNNNITKDAEKKWSNIESLYISLEIRCYKYEGHLDNLGCI